MVDQELTARQTDKADSPADTTSVEQFGRGFKHCGLLVFEGVIEVHNSLLYQLSQLLHPLLLGV